MNEENDVHIEQDGDLDDSVLAEESQVGSIKKLKEKLKFAEEKAKEYLDGWQRAQADFANLRRRDEDAKIEFLKFANQGLLEELIPVLDSFNIALSKGHKEIEPVFKQLLSVLKSKGIEELEPLGQLFDPRFHEAIAVTETEDKNEDHKVTEVLQKGYKLGDKVIRPAKVKIGEFKNN
jgi:molecular chaperone GrpE